MFLAAAKRTPVNLEEWAVQMMERHNRKSHLAPQLSPSTQALLRGESALSPSKESSASTASKTPTSGDIPIAQSEMVAAHLDMNGTGMHPSQTAAFDRQGYPVRASSGVQQSTLRSREADAFSPGISISSSSRDTGYTTTTLPIRPAPPPSGPLPQPPTTAFRNPNSKRPVTNGTSFPYGDVSQY